MLVFTVASPAQAAEKPWWKFWGGGAEEVAVDVVMQQHFTPEQRRLLRDFLAGERQREAIRGKKDKKPKSKPLPPGLKKKLARGGELPPGWKKKLARGEVVDAQVWAQSRPLPPGLQRQLGPVPPGTEIRYLDDQAYRVMRNTREIIDILGL
jgi:hypothetical protein